MSAFCEDERKHTAYPKGILGNPRPASTPLIRCLQWGENVPSNERDYSLHSAKDFIDGAVPGRLRIALLPHLVEKSTPADKEEFARIAKHYALPAEVLAERMRSVNHSFGSLTVVGKKAELAWCHVNCRQIHLQGNKISNSGYLRDEKGRQSNSPNALSLWLTCDFFLHAADDGTVTLLCFAAPEGLVDRFSSLIGNAAWMDILKEPYTLFVIIFDELHEIFDRFSKSLAFAMRHVEESATNGNGLPDLEFSNFHNVHKNCIFLLETVEAAFSTLEGIQETLQENNNLPTPTPASPDLRANLFRALRYRKRTFKSTILSVYSSEKRVTSSIQVYQALVTQNDSRAMKFIAVLTLIFLP
ncbi:hypothetical protein Q7P37_004343 [Cladosporium fusiforme]